ncbi:MAG: ribosome-associated translation inhibitor RaiA [Ruminococcaceae bacterium]|nr:ribosome-associated translation inhibitor RaiA [Oscillospiraceae bacterium]
MKITIVGRQLNVFDDTKAMIEKKLAKLDKFFKDGTAEAVVTLSRKRNTSTLEVTINASGTLFRSEVDADDFRVAMDETIDRIERQIRKNKTRLAKKLRETAFIPEPLPEEVVEEDPGLIIRTKKFEYQPMTAEEAIMQMNLLGHSFYIYNDADTGDTCVVYARKDGSYGLIEPLK